MSEPPRYEPSGSSLSSYARKIQVNIDEYQDAPTPQQKQQALANIAQASSALHQSSTSPQTLLQQFDHQPLKNAAVRIALEMGVFDKLPDQGFSSAQELAEECNADADFMQRILRAVASVGILNEVGVAKYAHTEISKAYRMPMAKANMKHLLDSVAVAAVHMNQYFQEHGFKSPTDHMNTPGVFARGLKDVAYFDWLGANPKEQSAFNEAMVYVTAIGVKEVASAYAFDDLPQNSDGVKVVDVGGGKGHVSNELISVHPGLAGHMVLEDIAGVINNATLVDDAQVKRVVYNFLEQEQPVRGAGAYVFRHIFHDWSDQECLSILRNHANVMSEGSRLLIFDLVLPDQGAHARMTLRDINMMHIAGMERSEGQWRSLLNAGGFEVVNIQSLQVQDDSIIEAVPKRLK